ncbi:hypothetical protein MKW98_007246 [Papaver atlanticum]|uniref:EF-hand domain-containing protein n=1 Tax=Papaver atlanticum TaxID=357466 RepID=A0AAD4XT84_9MAGN|nr:hypothetical protein MKW98_007246 [Papaver atlanticum]
MVHDHVEQSPLIIKQVTAGRDSPETGCEHMFGFLPCTENLLGLLFMFVVYEYLLFLGEKCICLGSEIVFQMLGTGVFGACAFEILGAFPEGMIILVSGLSKSKEVAEEKVLTGVGLLAGSTVLLLTLLWGTCVILGKSDFSDVSVYNDSKSSALQKLWMGNPRSYLTGSGIITDHETSYTARIMVVSVVPFIILQVPSQIIHELSYGRQIILLTTLVVSVAFLLSYFVYQIFEPWIQKRRLEYLECHNLMARVLRHVEKQATGKLLTDEGTANIPVIERLFKQIDIDVDDCLSSLEFKELLLEDKSKLNNADKNNFIEVVIKEFDLDSDHMISKEEFVNGFAKWLAKNKNTVTSQRSYSQKFVDNSYQEKMVEYAKSKLLIQEILRYFQNNTIGKLISDEGVPNISILQRLFEKVDLDQDNRLSHSELKKLVETIQFGTVNLNVDVAVEELIEELDTDGDHLINKEEFVKGLSKILIANSNEDTWPKTDKVEEVPLAITVVEKEKTSASRRVENEEKTSTSKRGTDEEEALALTSKGAIDESWKTSCKAGFLLMLGILIITLLAEPLIEVVQDFSNSANIPSFFVSFVLLPLATNSRKAVSAIKAARRKKSRTMSLTFSEIYGSVYMNNVLGLTALLVIVYARDLKWEFTAEVLVVLIVCVVMGLIASFRTEFPLWTSYLAYLLYPLSLTMVYILNYVLHWH